MGIKSIFGKVAGFVGGLAGALLPLSQAIDLAMALFKIGVAQRDVQKILAAADALDEVADKMDITSLELREASGAIRDGVAETGPGGRDLTGNELIDIGGEVADIGPAAKEIGEAGANLVQRLRDAL